MGRGYNTGEAVICGNYAKDRETMENEDAIKLEDAIDNDDTTKLEDTIDNDDSQMADHVQGMKCPACGAPIALDEGIEAVVCGYCGTKVFVDDEIYRYHRMLKVRSEAKHRDARAQLDLDKEKEVLETQRKVANAFDEKPVETVSVILCTVWLLTRILSGHFGLAHIIIEFAVILWAVGAQKRPLIFTDLGAYLKNNRKQAIVFIASAMGVLFGFVNGGSGLFLISLAGLVWSIKSGQKTGLTEDDINHVYVRNSAVSYSGRSYIEAMEELRACGFTDIVVIKKKDLVKGWFAKAGSVASISINGDMSFSQGQEYPADAKVVIEYHEFKE